VGSSPHASGLPGGWVLDGGVAALILAAISATLLTRSRRPKPPDRFEFVR
jgi:hypothetical protein